MTIVRAGHYRTLARWTAALLLARAAVAPAAPPLVQSFAGPFSYNGGYPADPVIAAGPSGLVAVANEGVALVTKGGVITATADLFSFFQGSYDPKVAYDPYATRFVVTSLSGDLIQIAVSKTSAPSNVVAGAAPGADWFAFSIDGHDDPVGSSPRTTPDFDGLGLDADNVYITANMYAAGGIAPSYVKIFVVKKAGLLTGGPITVHTFGSPPDPPLGNPVTGMKSLTIMPSINVDATPEHLVATPLETSGTSGRATLFTITNPSGTPGVSARDLLLPDFTGIAHPDCAQLGGGYKIDSGFVGTMSVVERGGHLWAAHTAPSAPYARSEIHWYEIDPTSANVTQSGQVLDPVRCYFYPAIEADPLGNVAIVMSGVDATIYPGAYYTARLATDPPGTMSSVESLHDGLGNWSIAAPPARNRWGDYGGIATDPATSHLWLFHMYASGTNDFATWIGELDLTGAAALGRSLLGVTLLLDEHAPAAGPPRRRLKAFARDLEPLPIQGDPITAGATLSVDVAGATASAQTLTLPAGARVHGTSVGWDAMRPAGFRYRDPRGVNGPVRLVQLQQKGDGTIVLRVMVQGATEVTLRPPDPGTSATVTLAIGSGDRFCTTLGGSAGGRVRRNDAVAFQLDHATAKTACP